jgi:hypothetical protein
MTPLKIFPMEGGGKIVLRSCLNRVRILLLILEKIFYVASFLSFVSINCLKNRGWKGEDA